jgi:hypothetical protein
MNPDENRIKVLPCWNGAIEISQLHGGLSNANYLVKDANGKHVVRFGKDYPFHHVSREREIMVARAADEAGFAPKLEYASPGVMPKPLPPKMCAATPSASPNCCAIFTPRCRRAFRVRDLSSGLSM